MPEGQYALAQAAIYLSLAPKSDAAKKAHRRGARATCASTAPSRRRPTCRAPATTPRRARPRRRLRLPPRPPGPPVRPGAAARGRGGRALLRARRRRGGAARAPGGDPPGARAGSLASPWRRPQPLHSSSPSARPPARDSGAVAVARPRDVAAAVEEAASVQPLWAMLRLGDRARYMARAAQAVIDEFDELADLIVAEQGRPRAEVEVMELLPAVETLQWLAEHGPGILAGERIPFSRTQHPVKRGRWTYEPLGVVGVLGPADRAVRHAAGRRRRRADGGQRRRAQALAPRAAVRRADRARLRPRRAARGAARGRPRPHRRRRRARRRPGGPGPLHGLGARGARGRRGVRARPQALGARARRQGRDARARRRQRPARGARRGVGGVRQRGPVRRLGRARAVRAARSTIASSPGSCRRRRAAARRRPGGPGDLDRPARRPRARRRGCARWSTRPSAQARRCTAAAPRARRTSRRPCSAG